MKRLIFAVPVLGFAVLAFFLFRSLILPAPDVLPSALIDKPAPSLAIPALDADTQGFGPKDLAAGHVTVINVFASWCVPCHEEAPLLDALARQAPTRLDRHSMPQQARSHPLPAKPRNQPASGTAHARPPGVAPSPPPRRKRLVLCAP